MSATTSNSTTESNEIKVANTDSAIENNLAAHLLHTEEAPQPALPERPTVSGITMSLFMKEHKLIHGKGRALAAMLTIGIARDAIWAYQTVKNTHYFDGKLNAFWDETFTQLIGGLPSIIIAGHFSQKAYTYSLSHPKLLFIENKKYWLKKIAVLSLASWSAIPVWNGAQLLGTWTGEQLRLSNRDANYFAGIFTGVTESLWQNKIVIPTLLNEPADNIEIALNILSGAVWQWVLTACMENLADKENYEYKTSASIAFSVAASTCLMTLLAWLINKTCCSSEENVITPPSAPNTPNRYSLFPKSENKQKNEVTIDVTASEVQDNADVNNAQLTHSIH